MMLGSANGTEHGASVYPVGIETVLPGLTPSPGGTTLYGYSVVYSANQFDNAKGSSAIPRFRLKAVGNAFKLVHSWNVHLLGGTLSSNIAVPFVYERVNLPNGSFNKFSIANASLGIFEVCYKKGNWHWLYEGDVLLPGGSYAKLHPLNVGQHNFSVSPVGAFSYLPFHGKTEISSKLQYIINFTDTATHYHSGNEFAWEYDAMQDVWKRVAIGVNGFFYKQTTDDKLNGVVVADGFRGRDFAVGPELRFRLGPHSGFALKYQRDTLVQNKPRGNAFWFQIAVPLRSGKAAK